MGKAEISWKTRDEDGNKREVYGKRVGDKWHLHERGGRFDSWEEIEKPSLEDWMDLLDGVKRRIGRHRVQPEEEKRLKDTILRQYPKAEF